MGGSRLSFIKDKTAPPFDFDQGIGTIDIWWLSDDGGLTALVAELLSSHSLFKRAQKKRLMMVVTDEQNWSEPLVTIQQMISSFRLNMEFSPVPTEVKGPAKRNVTLFEEIAGMKLSEFNRPKVTSRLIRVGELMRQHSKKALMCFVTLPTPNVKSSSVEYLATMDWLSMHLPPTILMRGANQ